MSADFITSYPKWFFIFCIAAGALYTALLYGRNKIIDPDKNQKWTLYVLSIFRFLAVTIVAFLLLEPLLRYSKQEVEKPIVVLAIDNSESMVNAKDSAFVKNQLAKALNGISEKLQEKFEIVNYTFGSKNQLIDNPDFSEKETDMSAPILEIKNAFEGKSIAAVVMATDGIFNKGSNPYYTSQELKAPIFTIGFGDTTIKSDFLIASVRTNAIAYLGNTFPVVVDVTARKCANTNFKVQVFYNGKLLEEQTGNINGNPFSGSFSFMLKAQQKGTQSYAVRISRLDGEVTYLNNQKDFFIDVIDGRQKLLMLASAPHPDISAFKQALADNENYELTYKMGEIPALNELKGYDLVIMHNWLINPAQKSFSELLKAQKMPVLYVLGRQSNLSYFSNLVGTSAVRGINNSFNQSTAAINETFSLFELSSESKAAIEQFPPLTCPFGKYEIAQPDKVVLSQRIGIVNSREALWTLNDQEAYRTGFISGEGFWRWWLNNYEQTQNHDACKELFTKTIQWLALKTDKRKFRVTPFQNSFNENEPLVFQAEVYNDNYEAVNKEDVTLDLKDEKGKSFPFTFSKIGDAYKLVAGTMPPGKYNYSVKTLVSGKQQVISGNVVVKPLQLETTETIANHNLLLQMAENSGGKFISKDSITQLGDLISKLENAKPIIYTEKTFKDLIHQKWLFFIILMLLGVEWGIRKFLGGY
jgi:hypothetical protein